MIEPAVAAAPPRSTLAVCRTLSFPMRCLLVARRNYIVWRKLLLVALLGHLAEPLIWLACIGLGLGSLLPPIEDMSYLQFLTAGMLANSVMNTASAEAIYGASSRWKFRRVWEAILNAPMGPADIVTGEWLWAGTKGAVTGLVILLVMLPFGLIQSPLALFIVPVVLLAGLSFAGIAMVFTGLSPREDLYTYYFSLALLPLMSISGVFFPVGRLPEALQIVAHVLPLSHAVDLVRALSVGKVPASVLLHVTVLLVYATVSIVIAVAVISRRLTR
ncbi:MAG TPA: ABC transporter permease [Steroidobacteraceae bacterium]|nr:ABC transporter permease [Steroidobacteraceae bacterium]